LIRLPLDATEAELRDLCKTYTRRLDAWLQGETRSGWRYDGTIRSLCDAYEKHPDSPIHEVRRNTAAAYSDSLKIIRTTVGLRAIRALVPMDVKHWYATWRSPKAPGAPERVEARPRRSVYGANHPTVRIRSRFHGMWRTREQTCYDPVWPVRSA
jgi:hypothetical protein